MKDNDKTVPIIKLSLWLIFIIVLIIIVKFGGKKDINNDVNTIPETNNTIEKISFEEKLAKLTDNYKYSYIINIGDKTYTFNGSKMNNRESGYRLFLDEKLQYFKENGYTYEVKNGGLFQIDTLYNEIDSSLLDITNIKNLINNQEYKIEDDKYIYTLDNREIIISTNDNDITNIEIKIGENIYNLNYSDIGKITDIAYWGEFN